MNKMSYDILVADKNIKTKFEKLFRYVIIALDDVLPSPKINVLNIMLDQGYWSGVEVNIDFDINEGFSYWYRGFGLDVDNANPKEKKHLDVDYAHVLKIKRKEI